MLEFRLFLSTSETTEKYLWDNRFVFDTTNEANSARAKLLAMRLITFARAVSLASVKIEACLVFEYGHTFAGNSDTGAALVMPAFAIPSEARAVRIPCEPYVAMQFQKMQPVGKSGRFWMFHSLNQDEVFRGRGGQLTLVNASEWQQIVEFWWTNGVEQLDDFRFYITPRVGAPAPNGASRVLSVTAGYPVQARARERSRAHIDDGLAKLLLAALAATRTASNVLSKLESYDAFNEDFVPEDMVTDVIRAISEVHAVGEQIKAYADSLDDDGEESKRLPFNRFGIEWMPFVAYVKTTTAELDTDIQALTTLKTYRFVDRGSYFTHADLQKARDTFDKYYRWLASYHAYDYLTPYKVDGDTHTTSEEWSS